MLKKPRASTKEPANVFQQIIEILEQQKIPRKKLAEKLNIHPTTLDKKLRGISPFILNECYKICRYLDVDYEEVFLQH